MVLIEIMQCQGVFFRWKSCKKAVNKHWKSTNNKSNVSNIDYTKKPQEKKKEKITKNNIFKDHVNVDRFVDY